MVEVAEAAACIPAHLDVQVVLSRYMNRVAYTDTAHCVIQVGAANKRRN